MNILLIGPIPPPITGTGISNKIIIEKFLIYSPGSTLDTINTNASLLSGDIGKFSWRKIFYFAGKYCEATKIFRHDKIYLTVGLTYWGILKYAPYIFLSRLLKKEIIIHIHGDHLWQEYKKIKGLFRWSFKTILSMADKGIVLSPLLKRNLQPFLAEKDIYVVLNGVEDNLFQFDPSQKMDSKFDKLRIFYLSNLMQEKGVFDLLEALGMLKQAKIPFEAYLAGSIEDGMETRIKRIIESLEPEVCYLGIVVGEAKKSLMMNSNVFVLPTYYAMEGQPISLLEAMATGNVILTTEHAGIPDVFQDGVNGYYVEKQNPASIVEKLLHVHKNLEGQKSIALNNILNAQKIYRTENFLYEIKRVFEK